MIKTPDCHPAHIEGVVSEQVVRSGHPTQDHPETIREIKRILIEHVNGGRQYHFSTFDLLFALGERSPYV